MKTELLAPAGDIEAGYAALYYGADAVYLGLQQFSARATATNFSAENLNEFVGYAHSLGRKVFVAVNTLVREDELSELLLTLDCCSRCKVDAVIIQDLGVARIVRESYPELEMHASTQMAVHNKEGALALQKAGFSRVVVARELTLAEIKEIAAIPGLETEAFIHGALCFSYSGLCLFSAMETGRSANRGKCLYPCRAAFKGEAGEKHYFSMKDMALREDVLKMPVTSLKIEGRKKTALYVAAVTDYYRRILDGKGADAGREENIKQIFSRPWCKFHFKGKDKAVIDRDFVGHRGLPVGKISQVYKGRISLRTMHRIARYDGMQIDIPGMEKPFGFSVQGMRVKGKNVFEAAAGDEVEILLPPQAPHLEKGLPLYLASATAVKGAYGYEKPKPGAYRQRQGIQVRITVHSDRVEAECGSTVVRIGGKFEPAANREKNRAAVEQAMAKTGETCWQLAGLEIDNPQNLFVPVSLLNELRRKLYAEIRFEEKHGILPVVSRRKKANEAKWILRTDQPEILTVFDFGTVDEITVMLAADSNLQLIYNLPKNKVRIGLPAVCRRPSDFQTIIDKLLAAGFRKWEIGNYWGLSVLPENGIDLSFDASLYMMNNQAVEAAKEMGASRVMLAIEDWVPNMQKLVENSPLPVVLAVYGDPALFTSAACIRTNACKDCPRGEKRLHLQKDGIGYEVLSKNCQTVLYRKNPFSRTDEAKDIKADYYQVDFMYRKYDANEAMQTWRKIRFM